MGDFGADLWRVRTWNPPAHAGMSCTRLHVSQMLRFAVGRQCPKGAIRRSEWRSVTVPERKGKGRAGQGHSKGMVVLLTLLQYFLPPLSTRPSKKSPAVLKKTRNVAECLHTVSWPSRDFVARTMTMLTNGDDDRTTGRCSQGAATGQ